MSEAPGRDAEFIPNQREITLGRKIKRIDTECARRIAELYPLQDQINILVAMLFKLTGAEASQEIKGVASAAYHLARDRDRAPAFFKCVSDHRHAAEALKVYCERNKDRLAAIDVAAAHHWPKKEGPADEN